MAPEASKDIRTSILQHDYRTWLILSGNHGLEVELEFTVITLFQQNSLCCVRQNLNDPNMQRRTPNHSILSVADEEPIIIARSSQSEHFRFFDLPRNLKDRIYHFALQGLTIKYDFAPKPTKKTSTGAKETPFTYTSPYRRTSPSALGLPDIRRATSVRIYTQASFLHTSPWRSNTQCESCTSCGVVPSSDELSAILGHLYKSKWKPKQMELHVAFLPITLRHTLPDMPCHMCGLLRVLPTGSSR
jgi:hypothetical protein